MSHRGNTWKPLLPCIVALYLHVWLSFPLLCAIWRACVLSRNPSATDCNAGRLACVNVVEAPLHMLGGRRTIRYQKMWDWYSGFHRNSFHNHTNNKSRQSKNCFSFMKHILNLDQAWFPHIMQSWMELYDDHRGTSNQLYRKFNYIQAERERNATGKYMKMISALAGFQTIFLNFKLFTFYGLFEVLRTRTSITNLVIHK